MQRTDMRLHHAKMVILRSLLQRVSTSLSWSWKRRNYRKLESITNATELHSFPLKDAVCTRHLVWFDGPLLSEFRIKGKPPYLSYWCDTDGVQNRWMFVSVNETDILRLENNLVGLDHIIPFGTTQPFVYFQDVNDDGDTIRSFLCEVNDVPDSYKPRAGANIDFVKPDQDANSYTLLIQDEWTHRELSSLSRNIVATYSTVYTLGNSLNSSIQNYPVGTGFAGGRFYDEMIKSVPIEDKGRLAAIQYSSPGFVRYAIRTELLGKIIDVVRKVRSVKIAGPYAALDRYYKDNELNGKDPAVTADHEAKIHEHAKQLLNALDLFGEDDLFRASASKFAAGKILISFVRKLRWLNARVTEDRLTLP
ncbi:MAG: hypothetical protein AAFX06_26610 [Planctomycetota bacterium]